MPTRDEILTAMRPLCCVGDHRVGVVWFTRTDPHGAVRVFCAKHHFQVEEALDAHAAHPPRVPTSEAQTHPAPSTTGELF